MYLFSITEKIAVEAKLATDLCPSALKLFQGFECISVSDETATVLVQNEYNAIQISLNFKTEVVLAIESITKLPIRNVFLRPRLADS
jgi:hypothetical protein